MARVASPCPWAPIALDVSPTTQPPLPRLPLEYPGPPPPSRSASSRKPPQRLHTSPVPPFPGTFLQALSTFTTVAHRSPGLFPNSSLRPASSWTWTSPQGPSTPQTPAGETCVLPLGPGGTNLGQARSSQPPEPLQSDVLMR